ncbi:MAG: hypothetical protein Q8O75_00110 [bacterium]|nr:hypothetical protein [bacterium]
MSEKFRQTLIGFIWPGPVAGPLPINFFRILAPVLVFYIKPILAALVVGIISALLAIFYYSLLELTGGKEYLEKLLKKLPAKIHARIETRGPLALFATSLVVGIFPYAVTLKLLKYPEGAARFVLVLAALVSAAVWTGVVWGSIVTLLRQTGGFAF